MSSRTIAPESPYKGLRPFEATAIDALLFFGREHERELIAANLSAARLTVLYGESGVGKSSVLRAGVVQSLRQQAREGAGFAVALYARWSDEDPIEGIAEAVREAVEDVLGRDPGAAAGTLAERLAAWSDFVAGEVYVVLDQVDEYFLYHGSGGGPLLDELPLLVTESGLRVNVLLGIREDSLARLDVFKARIPNLFGNYLRLERLGREAGRAAIVGPLQQWSKLADGEAVTIEPALVDTILDEVAVGRIDGNGSGPRFQSRTVEPPYLQIVLERIWDAEREAGSSVLRLGTLERLGGARRVVSEHLDRALGALSADERDTAAAMFGQLVTPSGAKVAHDVADLAGYAAVDEPDARRVADALVEERILRTVEDPRGDGARVEIFHDVLAAAVAEWRREHDASRQLELERATSRQRHRRLLVLVVVALVALAAMTLVAAYAIVQQQEADDQRAIARVEADAAEAGEGAAKALLALPTDPGHALELAAGAAAVDATARTEDVLRTVLVDLRQRATFGTGRAAMLAATFSPDGRRIAAGDASGRIVVAETRGKRIAHLRHSPGVNTVAFAGGSRVLASGGDDGTIAVWDMQRAPGKRQVGVLRQGGRVIDLAVSGDGTLLASASTNRTVRIWTLPRGAAGRTIPFPAPVESVSFDANAHRVLVVGGGNARVFDAASGRELARFEREGKVNHAAISSDGRYVATGHTLPKAGITRVWDVRTGRRVRSYSGHTGKVVDVDFSPVGPLLVDASVDYTARSYNVSVRDARTFIAPLIGHTNRLTSARFSSDGKRVVTASADKTAAVWKVEGNRLMTLIGHKGSVTGAELSPDGRYVLTWSMDGTARVWDPEPDPVAQPVARMRAPPQLVRFGADGAVVARVDANPGQVRVSRLQAVARALVHPAGSGLGLTLSPDGKLIALSLGDGQIHIATAEGQDVGSLLRLGSTPYVTAGFSGDGRRFAAAGLGGRVVVWDVADGRQLQEVRSRGVAALALDKDGGRLALGNRRGLVTVWRATDGTLLHELKGHGDAVTSLAFSPNGRLLVSGSRDHDARVWRLSDWTSMHRLSRHSSAIRGVSFSPDGRWVLTVGEQRVGLWSTATGSRVVLLQGNQQRAFLAATFAPDSRVVLTADSEGLIRRYRCAFCGHIGELRTLAAQRLRALRPS